MTPGYRPVIHFHAGGDCAPCGLSIATGNSTSDPEQVTCFRPHCRRAKAAAEAAREKEKQAEATQRAAETHRRAQLTDEFIAMVEAESRP